MELLITIKKLLKRLAGLSRQLKSLETEYVQPEATPNVQREQKSRILVTGKYSYGIDNINIRSWGEGAHLFIGGFCSIARNQTIFLGGNHRTDWTTTFPFGHIFNEAFPAGQINGGHGHPATKGHVIIENDVWIGEGCTIMSGIRIGSGSIVAAKSVVTKDVEPYTIIGGNPAKPIKQRFPQHIIQQLLEIRWWDRSDDDINKIVPLLQMPTTEEILGEIVTTLE